MTPDTLRDQARAYYEAKLRAHGATPAGMDWSSQASQELRFRQFARLWEDDPEASVVDYGCGYAALASYLRERGHRGPYLGFDLSADMIHAAGKQVASLDGCRVTSRRDELSPLDYAVASGVLNVKQQAGDAEWATYVRETIADLAALGTRGFAFNALTLYSDVEKRRPDLYYADPLELFDHCKRTYSRFVTLLHDYPLYEFTLLVRR
ncbi:MAG TPA: class I SAM-dependent methyltransferase [Vicinamibacterales bacterium]|nr:class I SAM-dependent methyltransferase [Vicinamibacterales bacterium]